ncbi:Hypothetical protein A7982_09255 [Minicystis rosea]|nr:Hypothetical protein A7982_09255 [Minicystis rosea]
MTEYPHFRPGEQRNGNAEPARPTRMVKALRTREDVAAASHRIGVLALPA